MTLVLVKQGSVIALKASLNHTPGENLDLKLFANDRTPLIDDTEADYTEATFTGYVGIELVGSNWVVTEAVVVDDVETVPAQAEYPEQSFQSSAGQSVQNVYGYYLVQHSSGKLFYAERFSDGPYPIQNNGDLVNVTPVFGGKNLPD